LQMKIVVLHVLFALLFIKWISWWHSTPNDNDDLCPLPSSPSPLPLFHFCVGAFRPLRDGLCSLSSGQQLEWGINQFLLQRTEIFAAKSCVIMRIYIHATVALWHKKCLTQDIPLLSLLSLYRLLFALSLGYSCSVLQIRAFYG